ncbi:KIRREL [Branchiostoma lanceolatum]|uniref:KIRREL protein n=1 Tax=Branchiostoma lanceolatum TaxID=7740 RepID=A0A8J9YI30_BRALA|nr:KIRREL [Branchiostoma lanceolatum]
MTASRRWIVIFILTIWWSSYATGASYRTTPKSVAVLTGRTVTLACSFDGLRSSDPVIWEGPPDYTVISSGTAVFKDFKRHRIVGNDGTGEFNLEIRDTRITDAGEYRCSTTSVERAGDATLTVVAPMDGAPDITGAELPLTAGDELLLTCRSRGGYPPPQLTWYNGTQPYRSTRPSQPEDTGGTDIELFTPDVTRWDNGANFTCVADQGFPSLVKTKSASRILRVHYPPVVIVPSHSVHVLEGRPTNLTCYVDANPRAMVSWKKLGDVLPIESVQRGSTLHIPRTARRDSGVYQCTADNGVEPTGVGSVSLQVFYPPVIETTMDAKVTVMLHREDFSLNCQAEGNPKPQTRWRRKDTTLYWENPLRFHRVRYDVEGTYQCVATSDGFPAAKRDVRIDVVGQPQIQSGSSFVSTRVGGSARFHCDVTADPLPDRITWSMSNKLGQEINLVTTNNGISIDERPTPDGRSSVLSLTDVSEDDEGTYICKASNMFGSHHKEIRLAVIKGSSMAVVISVSVVILAVVTVMIIFVCVARARGWICNDEEEAVSVPHSKPVPPLPKYARKPGHGTNDSGVEDLLELQELDGTLKPRPPPRTDKEWTAVGLSYTGLAHPAALPSYSSLERQRPDGQDIISPESIQEEGQGEDVLAVRVDPPLPPPKKRQKMWKRRGDSRGPQNHHEAENVLNEIQAESL